MSNFDFKKIVASNIQKINDFNDNLKNESCPKCKGKSITTYEVGDVLNKNMYCAYLCLDCYKAFGKGGKKLYLVNPTLKRIVNIIKGVK